MCIGLEVMAWPKSIKKERKQMYGLVVVSRPRREEKFKWVGDDGSAQRK